MAKPLLSEEDEKTVGEGQAAAALLESPIFLIATERLRAQCAEGILTSDPSASRVREELYNLSRGLSAVTEELTILVSLAQSTLDNAERPTSDDEVQAEPDSDDDE